MTGLKRILITGATGHLGSRLCRLLSQDPGCSLHALVRPSSDLRGLTNLRVRLIKGDVTDLESYRLAARGCDHLYHLAGVYSHNPRDTQKIFETAQKGTYNFLEVCRSGNIKKAVFTSSVASLGTAFRPTDLLDERSVLSENVDPYLQSKADAQKMVLQTLEKEPLPIVLVLPSTTIGPGDFRLTPSNRLILGLARKASFAYIEAGINVVHVDDVVMGHRLAMDRGRIKEKYILAGSNVSIYDLMSEMARLQGYAPPKLKLARSIVYPAAACLDFLACLSGRNMPITRKQAARIGRYAYFTIDKSAAELGYKSRNLEATLSDAICWYAQQKWLSQDHSPVP